MNCHCRTEYESGEVRISAYESEVQPTWCGGCGNFGIWAALKRALIELKLKPEQVLLCFDIGCNGNMSDKIRGYRLHSLHGRVLPLAAGAKIANPDMHVIAMAGDGATYSEGINHLINSFRNNFPITFIVHDNGDYGLTTGQASATTPQGAVRNSNPDGPTASTLNPLDLALSLQPNFVAQGFSGNILQLTNILKTAITNQNKGFSFVNVLQECPTFNKETTHDWYLERINEISEDHDQTSLKSAKDLTEKFSGKINTGILYKNKTNPTYIERLSHYRKNFNQDNRLETGGMLSEVKKVDVTRHTKTFQ